MGNIGKVLYPSNIFRIIILVVAIAGTLDSKGFLGVKEAWGGKLCDVKIKYCAEQKCRVSFDGLESGVLNAYAFFEKLGYAGKYDVDIEIIPEVFIISSDGEKRTKIRVLGKYEEGEKTIYLTCWGEKWLLERKDFHIDMTNEFYKSVVTHEMIHFLANRYAKKKLDVLLSEYIAYSGQLEFLPQKTIAALAEHYKLQTIELKDLNEMAFMLAPGTFGLKSYLHYKQTNGVLVKEIIAGSFKSQDYTSFPF